MERWFNRVPSSDCHSLLPNYRMVPRHHVIHARPYPSPVCYYEPHDRGMTKFHLPPSGLVSVMAKESIHALGTCPGNDKISVKHNVQDKREQYLRDSLDESGDSMIKEPENKYFRARKKLCPLFEKIKALNIKARSINARSINVPASNDQDEGNEKVTDSEMVDTPSANGSYQRAVNSEKKGNLEENIQELLGSHVGTNAPHTGNQTCAHGSYTIRKGSNSNENPTILIKGFNKCLSEYQDYVLHYLVMLDF